MVNIIGHRYINLAISGILFLLAIGALLVFGLKPGNDFRGGSLLEIGFIQTDIQTADIKNTLGTFDLGGLTVQKTNDNGAIIKLRFLSEDEHQQILEKLRADFETEENKVLEYRFETIGPAVSQELRSRSLYAVIAVVLGIIIFVAYSFRRVSKPVASWKYGVAAVVSIVHDVTITAGVFAVLGHYLGIEVDIPFVVALLTVLGYSVNDTIVVFDRIREKLIRHSADDFAGTVNLAINETFARSINTTLTTLITLSALYIWGGETVKNFVLALLIGIFLGAYSSIFVASPLLVEWHRWQERKYSK